MICFRYFKITRSFAIFGSWSKGKERDITEWFFNWDKLPDLYQQMLDYANKNNLQLTGYAYEVGLNDFVISDEADYITKIMIKIKETSWLYS